MASSPPVRLQIPVIGVDSGLLALGLQDDGTLEVPPDAASVGWFTGGPMPGELGPAVIVGHVDWGGALGIFYDLRNLAPQDEITVTREDGSVAVFQVRTREQFPKDQFPTDAVYGNIDHAGLRLITCGGSFDRRARSYEDNIIVFADLVDSSSP
jgi:sortase (surface protein transpeptidase)